MTALSQQVFISYQRADADFARQVRDYLAAQGVKTWMDQYDIPVGAYWPDEIDKGLASSDVVVGILSSESVESRNVKNEWDWALQNDKRLVLLQHCPCVIPHRYVSINFIDASIDRTLGLRQLAEAVRPTRDETVTSALGNEPARLPSTGGTTSWQRSASAAIPERSEPFVGRERERVETLASIDAALGGKRQLLLIAGEPGIGKTRLAETITDDALQRGASVCWGRCYEWEGSLPYWPWVEILRAIVESLEPDVLAHIVGPRGPILAQIVPEITLHLGGVPALPPMDPDQARFRLFDAVARFLLHASLHRPVIAILDDLHWADPPSLLLLEFVVREVQRAPLLLVGAYRDTEVRRDHPLGRTVAALVRTGEPRRITLRGLSPENVGQYIHTTSGFDVDSAVVAAVSEGTDGNPFYVGEVVRLLHAEGRLRSTSNPDEVLAHLSLPQSIRDVVGRRLDRLSPDCNRLLALGSVIGRAFSLALLEQVTGRASVDLLDLLDEAATDRLITASAGFGHYQFSHAFIQQTLYEELSSADRVRLHSQVGQALERLHPSDLAPYYGELAHHFGNAPIGENLPKAIDYARHAGGRSMELLAWETAVRHFRHAVQLLDLQSTPDPVQRCEMLLMLGEAHYQIQADSPEARDALRQAADHARAIGSPTLLARAAVALSGANVFESYAGVGHVELLREALEILGPDDTELRVKVLSRLATGERAHGVIPNRSLALADEALTEAQRTRDPELIAVAHVARHAVGWTPDNLDERLGDSAAIIDHATRAGDLPLTAWGFFWHQANLLEHGDVAEAVMASDRFVELAATLPTVVFNCSRLMTQLMRMYLAGEYDACEPVMREALGLHHTLPYEPALLHLFVLRREQGRLGELDELMRPFRDNSCTPTYRILGLLLDLDLGNHDAAQAAWARLTACDFADIPRDFMWLAKLALLAEAAHALGDDRRAYVLMQLLAPYASRMVVIGPNPLCFGSVAHFLGLLATTLKDWDAAGAYFETAHSVHDVAALRALAIATQYAEASMLVSRNDPGDRQLARTLADAASQEAEKTNMRRLIRQSEALRNSVG